MRDILASVGVALSLLIAACLDDPCDNFLLDDEIADTAVVERDGCSISSTRTCGKIQCCRTKTCCVTLNGHRICSTTKTDCVPVPPETVAP